jgi:hypothetical protein
MTIDLCDTTFSLFLCHPVNIIGRLRRSERISWDFLGSDGVSDHLWVLAFCIIILYELFKYLKSISIESFVFPSCDTQFDGDPICALDVYSLAALKGTM